MKKHENSAFWKKIRNVAEHLSHYFETTNFLLSVLVFVGTFALPAIGRDSADLFPYAAILFIGYVYEAFYRGSDAPVAVIERLNAGAYLFLGLVNVGMAWFLWRFLERNGFRDSAFLIIFIALLVWNGTVLWLSSETDKNRSAPKA